MIPTFYRSYLKYPTRIYKNIKWRYAASISDRDHVFVLGAPRSGTTLLQSLIGGHSNFYSPGVETGLFTWQDIFNEERQHLGVSPHVLDSFYSECSDVVQFLDNLAAYVTKDIEARRFVEKTPQHILQLSFIQRHFPKSDIVHIHRDGRDCFCSARQAGIPRGDDLKSFAKYWAKCISKRLKYGEGILDVSYQSLTMNPETELRRVMDFIDADFEVTQLDRTNRKSDPRSSEDKFSRLSKNISARTVGRHKGELKKDEIDQFNKIAGEKLRSMGYEV